MTFPRYPKYKDSSVEWLGEAPAHWGTTKLGYEAWALDAHNSMSTQALNSDKVRQGLKDILINYAGLWEALRERPSATVSSANTH